MHAYPTSGRAMRRAGSLALVLVLAFPSGPRAGSCTAAPGVAEALLLCPASTMGRLERRALPSAILRLRGANEEINEGDIAAGAHIMGLTAHGRGPRQGGGDRALDDMDGVFDAEFRERAEAKNTASPEGVGGVGAGGLTSGQEVGVGGEPRAAEGRLFVADSTRDAAVVIEMEARLNVGDVDGAEAAFINALSENPTADVTAHYAAFLWHVRGDLDAADTLSLAAIDVQGSTAPSCSPQGGSAKETASLTALTTRAHVLKYIKNDAQGAYEMYQRAMRAYSGHAATYHDAALLFHPDAALDVSWQDPLRAEALYRKALALDEVGLFPACLAHRNMRTHSILLFDGYGPDADF